jgi:hypothetical protein
MGQVNLNAFIGKNITIIFKGITGGNFASDLAIDDIRVYSAAVSEPVGSGALALSPWLARAARDGQLSLNNRRPALGSGHQKRK